MRYLLASSSEPVNRRRFRVIRRCRGPPWPRPTSSRVSTADGAPSRAGPRPTPATPRRNDRIWSSIIGPMGQPIVVSEYWMSTSPLSCDLHVVHQAEVDDVDPQLRVEHVLQRLEDRLGHSAGLPVRRLPGPASVGGSRGVACLGRLAYRIRGACALPRSRVVLSCTASILRTSATPENGRSRTGDRVSDPCPDRGRPPGHPGRSPHGPGAVRRRRRRRRRGGQRRGGRRTGARAHTRRRLHGRPHARDGRHRGHAAHPPGRSRRRRSS